MEIPKKTRKDFINAAKVGDIVAFTVAINENELRMLSGKIVERKENEFVVQTLRGSTYRINENNIAWVRVEGHGWTEGIFTALKVNQAKN